MLQFSFLPEAHRGIVAQFEPNDGNPLALLDLARSLQSEGNLEGAATIYDRAYGLDPRSQDIVQGRAHVLDQLQVLERGLCFRYVPGGVFLMGNDQGDPDEAPWHPVWLSPYWVSITPISWGAYCRLMDWEPAPLSRPKDHHPPEGQHDSAGFHLREANKIRLQYCEDHTLRARGWHAHVPRVPETSETGEVVIDGRAPLRTDPRAPWEYEKKPMIAVGWQEAMELADHLSTPEVRYALPTEAQWEKAARGGLIGERHAWGDAPPTTDNCDFDRYRDCSIHQMETFPVNGYGLSAMNGGVWEWTLDWYDAEHYRHASDTNPSGPQDGKERVLRGGSWADCAEVISVTFRMSRESGSWRDGTWGRHLSPMIGFRLCRMSGP